MADADDDFGIIPPTAESATPEVHGSIIVELGRLTTRWGWLEATVEALIVGMLGTEPYLLYPITADIAIGTRIKYLGLLAKLRIGVPIDLDTFGIILSSLSELCGRRNALIHGLWYRSDDDPEVAIVMQTRPNKHAEIRQISMYCNACYIEWLVNDTERLSVTLHRFGSLYGLIKPPDA